MEAGEKVEDLRPALGQVRDTHDIAEAVKTPSETQLGDVDRRILKPPVVIRWERGAAVIVWTGNADGQSAIESLTDRELAKCAIRESGRHHALGGGADVRPLRDLMDAVREDVTCWCRSVEGFGDASGAAPDAPLGAAPSFKTLLR